MFQTHQIVFLYKAHTTYDSQQIKLDDLNVVQITNQYFRKHSIISTQLEFHISILSMEEI